ncbi:MAG: hypothetical protein ACJAZP_001550 [Psychromonas sp.]|jgi:hypothetical protein|uniref:PEP-CTERM sorting domain-containing protein n=1 Tax=Psychromonas sp. TaxID=1884585 RepID=UPI0039E47B59
MKKIISLLATSLVLMLATSTASARLIEGVINFTGGATISYNGAGTEVSALDFNGTTRVESDDVLVTGDFDGLENSFSPFTDFTVGATPFTLWSVGGFTFNITSFTNNEVIDAGLITVGILGGEGTITSTNPLLDETAGQWAITSNGASSEVSFSSTAVPAPAGAALLGLGLLGFGFARRNKKA